MPFFSLLLYGLCIELHCDNRYICSFLFFFQLSGRGVKMTMVSHPFLSFLPVQRRYYSFDASIFLLLLLLKLLRFLLIARSSRAPIAYL